MSTKQALLLIATAVLGYGLLHRAPPTIEAANTPFFKSIPARAQYGVGSAGTFVVGGVVRKLHTGTDQELRDMSTALKKKRGRDGDTAREAAATAWKLDSTSLEALSSAKPILAMNSAMKARNFVEVARTNLATP
jgi:hypothetical protein